MLLGLLASARGTRAGCLAGSLTNSIMRQLSNLDIWHVAKAAKLPELPSRCSGKFCITAGASLGDTFTSVSEHASTHFRQCSQEPELCNSQARADDTAGIKEPQGWSRQTKDTAEQPSMWSTRGFDSVIENSIRTASALSVRHRREPRAAFPITPCPHASFSSGRCRPGWQTEKT